MREPLIFRHANGDAEIARLDITRPDNAAPDQTEVLEHDWTEGSPDSRAE